MNRKTMLAAFAVALLASLFIQTPAMAADLHRVKARMFGPTPLKGNSVYREKDKNGQLLRRFQVQIQQAIPFQTFEVVVNGNTVGTITANAGGRGKFQLRTAAFIDSPGDGQPMPDSFPKLLTGDTVSVGPIAGVFFKKGSGGGGGGGGNNAQNYRLRGEFDGPGAISGKARYRERFKQNQLERRFTVDIEDAAPNATFSIAINGTIVGSVTTDATGEGELNLRTAPFIDDPNEWEPMPNGFPTLQVGDTVTIGDSTVVLQND